MTPNVQIQSFRGLRYDDPNADPSIALGVMDLSSVIVGADSGGRDSTDWEPIGYSAGRLLEEPSLLEVWISGGVVTRDPMPSLYIYRAGYRDDEGRPKQRYGVLGWSGEVREYSVCPQLIAVAPESELDEICSSFMAQPLARATDGAGTHYRLWATAQESTVNAVNSILLSNGVECHAEGLVAISTSHEVPPIGLVFGG